MGMLKFFLILLVLFYLGHCSDPNTNSTNSSLVIELPPTNCTNGTADLTGTLTKLPDCIVESALNNIATGLVYSTVQFYEGAKPFFSATPDINWFCFPYQQIMGVIESLYSLILMGVGLYFIIGSSDVIGRLNAKLWLKNIVYLIAILSFSFILFGIILDLNTYLSSSFYGQAKSNFLDTKVTLSNLIFAILFLIIIFLGTIVIFITLLVRYLLIPVFLLLFPIAICLYFIPPTRSIGVFILTYITIIIFLPSIDGLLFFAVSNLFSISDPLLQTPLIKLLGTIIGFLLIAFVNIKTYEIAYMLAMQRAAAANLSNLTTLATVSQISSSPLGRIGGLI